MQTDFVSQYAFRLIMPLKYLIILLLAFASCTADSRHRQLAMADAVMESAPDSAMTILADVDTAALSQSDYAYYSLLYTQAQIKTWVVVDTDSLFHTAYEAYNDHPDNDLRRRAYFYNAQIQLNHGDLQSAMRDVLTAYEIAKSEHNDYWLAKSAEMIGDIFTRTHNYPQSEKYRLEAVRCYKSAGRENSHRYALCDLARNYSNQNLADKGLHLVDSLKQVVEREHPVDSALMGYLLDSALPLYFTNNRFEDICKSYEDYLVNYYYDGEGVESYVFLSHVYLAQKKIPRSIKMLDEAFKQTKDEQDRGFVLYAQYYQACENGDYRLAVSLCDSLLYYDSRIVDKAAKESVTVVQRDFYNTKAYMEKKKTKALTALLIVAIIVVVLIVVLFVIIYRLRLNAKNTEIENLMSDFQYLKRNVEKVSIENMSLSDKLTSSSLSLLEMQMQLDNKAQNETRHAVIVEQLFHDKWGTFNRLCNDYFDMVESGLKPDGIVRNIERELKEFNSTKNIEALERSVDDYLGGIMTMLRAEMPDFKDKDIKFIVFVIAGFSVRAICLIMGIKYKNYYLIKSRLTRKIVESAPPHKGLFLEKLGK